MSLLFFIVARYVPLEKGSQLLNEMKDASEIMARALGAIRECREERGIAIDRKTDVNETGMIGTESSPVTTSLGNLEAKRTTTNPDFAALVVYLLRRAGVRKGDAIAVGASSSFPALIVAALSASKAMGARPLMITSLGASQWGANLPNFHWLDMQDCLRKAGVFKTLPVAVSLGGENDTGLDLNPDSRALLLRQAQERGMIILDEPDLRKNVQERMRLYGENAGEEGIRAFINIGGSLANMGRDSSILALEPGLTAVRAIPSPEKRGVIHEMALKNVPVIHLLFVKGLVKSFKLPWDPTPFPHPGEGKIFLLARAGQASFLIVASVYFLFLVLVLLKGLRRC